MTRLIKSVEYVAAIWGVLAFLYYWDPSRVLVKRLMAEDAYIYEEIAPRFREVPVNELITVKTSSDLSANRNKLVNTLWGNRNYPASRLPDKIINDVSLNDEGSRCSYSADEETYFASIDCSIKIFNGIKNLSGIDRLETDVGASYRSVAALFNPIKMNGSVILYHHGYAGTYFSQHVNISRLIEEGYAVLAFNLPGFGDNVDISRSGPLPKNGLQAARWTLEPVIVGLNFITSKYEPDHVAMMGFSAGGWVAQMAAALDTRIHASYIIASPYPLEFRATPQSGPVISRVRELLAEVNYYDLFVLGASGRNGEMRNQLQIYNQFDRCCWNNRTALLFELPIKEAVEKLGGAFEIKIDSTHARHKVSRQALDWVLADLEGGRQ